MSCAMTEAINHTFTPQLLYLSTQHNPENEVRKLLTATFGATGDEYISWINAEKLVFSIEMVRNLTQMMSYARLKGKTRHVILLAVDHATTEAQNALLKLLEEPPAGTQIWLTAVQNTKLLPTIISRCEEVFLNTAESALMTLPEISKMAADIPKLSYRELSDLAGNTSEREDAKKLIESLTLYFHAELENSQQSHYHSCLQVLLQTTHYLEANVNVRLALENAFFTLKNELSQTRGH